MASLFTTLNRRGLQRLTEIASSANLKLSQRAIACAAQLSDYFENWGKWKLEHHRTRWVYQPLKNIQADLMQYGRHTIRLALNFLVEVGILDRRRNPQNRQDRTFQYRFNAAELSKSNIGDGESETESSKSDLESSRSEIGQYHNNQHNNPSINTRSNNNTAIENAAGEVNLEEEVTGSKPKLSSREDAVLPRNEEESVATPESPEIDPPSPELNKTSTLLERVEDLGIAINDRITKAVSKADAEVVGNAIALTKSRRRDLSNPAGFLVEAIRKQWKPDVVEPMVHPVATSSSSANPAELRSKYAEIEGEQHTPEWQSGRTQFLSVLAEIKKRAIR